MSDVYSNQSTRGNTISEIGGSVLRHVTIITRDGISLYHKSYINDNLDDVLFSALTGAIIAFTKELGDELHSINMKKQIISFVPYGDCIVILSFKSSINISIIDERVKELLASTPLRTLCDAGMSQRENEELEDVLYRLFEAESPVIEKTRIEELTGEAFLDALKQLESI